MRLAALNTGPDFHLLDHIAPLASLMNMPLFLTEEKNSELAEKYYPQVQSIYLPDLEHRLSYFADTFDALFECKYWAPHLKQLFSDLYSKNMRLVFCPHGQSDKGYATPLLAPYMEQDIVLVYGQLMQEMLRELKVPARSVVVGNFRHTFYLAHQSFYDELVEKEIFSHLPRNKKTLLYAPTWNDADQATSFFESAPALFSEIPEEWNLLIKVHPLLEQRDPVHYYRIAALAERPNIHLLSEFPPIYPILARADAYLGDYSSVGYDFLPFGRPMLFLVKPSLPQGRLHACGTILHSPHSIFSQISKQESLKKSKQELYRLAFEKCDPVEISEKVVRSLSRY